MPGPPLGALARLIPVPPAAPTPVAELYKLPPMSVSAPPKPPIAAP